MKKLVVFILLILTLVLFAEEDGQVKNAVDTVEDTTLTAEENVADKSNTVLTLIERAVTSYNNQEYVDAMNLLLNAKNVILDEIKEENYRTVKDFKELESNFADYEDKNISIGLQYVAEYEDDSIYCFDYGSFNKVICTYDDKNKLVRNFISDLKPRSRVIIKGRPLKDEDGMIYIKMDFIEQ